MFNGKISIQQIPSPPLPSSPDSAATHSKYNGKRIKTTWLSHLLLGLCCLAPGHHSCCLCRTEQPCMSSASLCPAVRCMWPGQASRTNHHLGPASSGSQTKLNPLFHQKQLEIKCLMLSSEKNSASSSPISALMTYQVFSICPPLYGGLQPDDLKSSSQQPYEVGLSTFPILQRKEGLREVMWFAGHHHQGGMQGSGLSFENVLIFCKYQGPS